MKITQSKHELSDLITMDKLGENQFTLADTKTGDIVFKSYGRLIAIYSTDTQDLKLNADWWNYSNTTRKYFKQFINNYTAFNYETKKQWMEQLGGLK